ncbi:MAG: extracellular solute-binding protein [Treponema sp.]|nr:extracellular solute-binding protein [Treponema sp.]
MAKLHLNKTLRNFIIAVAAIYIIFALISLIPVKDNSKEYETLDDSNVSTKLSVVKTYTDYKREHANIKSSVTAVDVDVLNFDEENSTGARIEQNYHGKDVVFTEDRSSVTWTVEVPEEGLYNVEMEYIATPSRNVNMERIIYINGEVPFSGADTLSFFRLWKDGGPVTFDNRGNSIRPTQTEFFDYQTVRFKSDLGYEVDPYQFYFKAGENTITLESTNEPMAISKLALVPAFKYDTYEQYLKKQPGSPDTANTSDFQLKIQGEDAVARSDPSLFAKYDRSSATTEPYNVKNTVFNYIGGDSWKAPGQWIEWNFDIPEDGWYTISVKARQLYQRGYLTCRTVYIDGEVPIDALKSVEFNYSSDWEMLTLSDADKNPYNFYLKKGTHSIRLEATLGEIGNVINELQNSISRLNTIYRTILVLTGTYPDQFRDYEIHKVYPDEYEAMHTESMILYRLVDRFVKITGQKSDKIAAAETLALELKQFYKDPQKITQAFTTFKSNTTSLSSSMLSLTETKLDVDYILVQNAGKPVKSVKANFFTNAWHEIYSFFTSFFVDSTSLGSVYDENDEHLIEVWIVTGRDQSQILKNMIDDSFSPVTDIKVNVKLISIDSLLNAVVAGNGPDVVISVDASKPVNYALRNANVNLMRFPDCEEVLKQFKPSAYEPYKYNGGLYALPETEAFNLLFYRKDILAQLGLEVPKTWDDLINILPTLQGNNLDVGIPYPSLLTPDMSTFYSMVYQNGGTVYNPKGTRTLLDSEEGISAFKTYTSFFNSYGLPANYDFVNRFRTGEMPLGIANYASYNTLVVAAPEIRGLWDFTYILGSEKTDEEGNTYINRATVAGGVSCMMIKKGMDLMDLDISNSQELVYSAFGGKTFDSTEVPGVDAKTWAAVMKNETRIQDSWKFMKWWVSAETQVRFGREMEATLGASARYTTANLEALKQLSWNTSQLEVLEKSLDESVGIPEVPGSYYTPRHIVNGTRKVINSKEDARETLIDYARKINEELIRKRQEFNLPTE